MCGRGGIADGDWPDRRCEAGEAGRVERDSLERDAGQLQVEFVGVVFAARRGVSESAKDPPGSVKALLRLFELGEATSVWRGGFVRLDQLAQADPRRLVADDRVDPTKPLGAAKLGDELNIATEGRVGEVR